MTKLFEMAIEAARKLAPEEQDELARMILDVVHGAEEDVYVLSEEERAALKYSLEFADRGEFATQDEVRAVFSKYKL